jgi:hypothetical protein
MLKNKSKNKKKRIEHCDYHGACKNKAYKEVYPMLLGKKHRNRGWNYLCRKHFIQEQKRYKNKLPYASVD